MYGPCKTWMAWLVTDPELLATGLAVADTPPTVSAFEVYKRLLAPINSINTHLIG